MLFFFSLHKYRLDLSRLLGLHHLRGLDELHGECSQDDEVRGEQDGAGRVRRGVRVPAPLDEAQEQDADLDGEATWIVKETLKEASYKIIMQVYCKVDSFDT